MSKSEQLQTSPSTVSKPVDYAEMMKEAETLRCRIGVDFHGNKYLPVKDRNQLFRKYFGTEYGIQTELLLADDKYVRVKAVITNSDCL